MHSALAKLVSKLRDMLSQDFLKLFNDAAFMFVCRVLGAILTLATQVLLARWMGPTQLGAYALAFSWCMFLSVLAGLGFPRAAARFIGKGIAHNRDDLVVGFVRRQKQFSVIASLTVAAIGCAILLGTSAFQTATGREALLFAFIAVPVFAMINASGSVALSMSWFRTAYVPNTLLRPALLLLIVLAIRYSAQSLSAERVMLFHLAVALLIAATMTYVVGRRLKQRYPAVQPAFETRLWLRTAPPLLVITIFANYFQELNIISIGMYLQADELAVYNVSLRLSFLITFGILAVNTISMPGTAQLHAKGENNALQKLITHAARLQLMWSFCALVGIVIVGKYVLGIFGPSFVSGYVALIILAVAQLVGAMFGPAAQLLSMTGHQNKCLYIFLAALAAMLALNHLLVPSYGINGAATAVALTFLLQSTWLYASVVRRLGIDSSAFGFFRGKTAPVKGS